MADPGFPVGGVDPLGGVDLGHGHFLVKMYVKMKELGPVEGGRALGTPPRSIWKQRAKISCCDGMFQSRTKSWLFYLIHLK